MSDFEVISAAATRASKQEENQDRVISFELGPETDAAGAGVVLCDGVGGLSGSARAAEWASRRAADHVAYCGVHGGVWSVAEIWEDEAPSGVEGATTLLVLAAEASGIVAHTLIGNGSILEVAAHPLPEGGVRLLWTDVSLPQIDWSEGKPALDSVLPPPAGALKSSRGAHRVDGERMYVLCSDGISTLEERPDATAPDDTTWREIPVGVTRLFRTLSSLWEDLRELPAGLAEEALQQSLEEVLSGLAVDFGLDDDASLGLLLIRPVDAVEERAEREEGAAHA